MMNPSLLIFIAMVLVVAEIFLPIPSFGILGVAGLLSFVVGFYGLLQTLDPADRAPVIAMVVPSFLLFVGICTWIGTVLFKDRKSLFSKGSMAPVGEVGEAAEDFERRQGMIRIDGELWTAELVDEKSIKRGDKLLVLARNGLKLSVQNVQNA